jgi:predicted RNA methylase
VKREAVGANLEAKSAGAGIDEKVLSPGYTPRRRDMGLLFDLLGRASDDVAKHGARALSQLGLGAAPTLMERFEAAPSRERGRLVSLAGRIVTDSKDLGLEQWLVARLADPEPIVQRRAITALGKAGGPNVEAALLAAWDGALAPPEVRALVVALGNTGTSASIERLTRIRTEDAELSRVVREAVAKIERSALRTAPSVIDGTRALPRPVPILLHVRSGLEELLLEELGPEARGRVVGQGRVEVITGEPLARLFRARTFLHFGFPLPPEKVEDADPTSGVVRALSSDAAWEILSALTPEPVRYRIEWAQAGRRRGATFRVAERVRALRPGLVNDPTSAPWEAVVSERGDRGSARLFVELWPRALSDPRFTYRTRTIPAASHPTIAAALAHVAGVVPTDVVWDPFVGSGAELCERALLGPYAELFGTDLDPAALDAARENLTQAGALRFSLEKADARSYKPRVSPTLILTNPPFGRRVLAGEDLLPLFDWFLENAGRVLAPSGRLVWISPLGDRTAELAERRGLAVRVRRPVDVGGVPGEIQMFVRAGARARVRPKVAERP